MLHRAPSWILAVAVAIPAAGLAAAPRVPAQPPAVAQAPAPASWSTEQKKDFLAKAKVVKAKTTSKGVTRPSRVTLRRDGVTHDAAFQTVNVERLGATMSDGMNEAFFRDYWGYNIAAHELACLVNRCDLVPVAVERTWNGRRGAMVWWVDDVLMDEKERREKNVTAERPWDWNRQMYTMKLFTELTADADRNQTNILVTKSWDVVLIDFSRAFRRRTEVKPEAFPLMPLVEEGVLEGLRGLTADALKARAGDWLTDAEIEGVMKRRDAILANYEKRIAQSGAGSVVIPSAATARKPPQ